MEPGVRIGPYELIRRLGTGSVAEVWLAAASGGTGPRHKVIFKALLPHLARTPEFVVAYLDEARRAAVLNHPNVVRVLDQGCTDSCAFVTTEFVNGRSLWEVRRLLFAQRKTPPLWFVLRIAISACDGLGYAHGKIDEAGRSLAIVHRDLAPEHLLISFDGVTKLLGFFTGRVLATSAALSPGARLTRAAYQAPEQLRGVADLDGRTDVYALGVVLYELLTGRRPFQGANEEELRRRILDAGAAPPSSLAPWIPRRVDELLLRALAPDPAGRFADAIAFRHALQEEIGASGQRYDDRHVAQFLRSLFGAGGLEVVPPAPAPPPGPPTPRLGLAAGYDTTGSGIIPVAVIESVDLEGTSADGGLERLEPDQLNAPALVGDAAGLEGIDDEFVADLEAALDATATGDAGADAPAGASPERDALGPGVGDVVEGRVVPAQLRQVRVAAELDAAVARTRRLPPEVWDSLVRRARAGSGAAEAAPPPETAAAAPAAPAADEGVVPGEVRDGQTTRRHSWDAAVERVARESTHRFEDEPEMRTGPARAEALFERGLERMKEHDLQGALAAWTAALELDPGNRRYQGNLKLLKKLLDGEPHQ